AAPTAPAQSGSTATGARGGPGRGSGSGGRGGSGVGGPKGFSGVGGRGSGFKSGRGGGLGGPGGPGGPSGSGGPGTGVDGPNGSGTVDAVRRGPFRDRGGPRDRDRDARGTRPPLRARDMAGRHAGRGMSGAPRDSNGPAGACANGDAGNSGDAVAGASNGTGAGAGAGPGAGVLRKNLARSPPPPPPAKTVGFNAASLEDFPAPSGASGTASAAPAVAAPPKGKLWAEVVKRDVKPAAVALAAVAEADATDAADGGDAAAANADAEAAAAAAAAAAVDIVAEETDDANDGEVDLETAELALPSGMVDDDSETEAARAAAVAVAAVTEDDWAPEGGDGGLGADGSGGVAVTGAGVLAPNGIYGYPPQGGDGMAGGASGFGYQQTLYNGGFGAWGAGGGVDGSSGYGGGSWNQLQQQQQQQQQGPFMMQQYQAQPGLQQPNQGQMALSMPFVSPVFPVNPLAFDTEPAAASFFVVKTVDESGVRRSFETSSWAINESGGSRKMDAAWHKSRSQDGSSGRSPVYLFVSTNSTNCFCGIAEMVGPVEFKVSERRREECAGSASFPIRWVFVKNVPNRLLKQITLPNCDNRPLTGTRDAQEVALQQGREVLRIFASAAPSPSLLD
ncbi:unnamed protein product, partial [Phaeothamnion confervicola]